MCLAGDRCLVGFQENQSVSEHYCYSNDNSEMSGKGDTGAPPTQRVVCGLGVEGTMQGCGSVARV